MLSPVSIDSSIVVEPDLTTPSVGTFSPGLISSTSFFCRRDSGITRSDSMLHDLLVSSNVPTNVADSGARSASADTALLVRFFARASKYFPFGDRSQWCGFGEETPNVILTSSTNVMSRLELSNDCMSTGLEHPQHLLIAL